jgi:thiopeptide-type bacteriocin biosynthesis protein
MSGGKQGQQAFELIHSGFFALRTPILPANELRAWSSGVTASQVSPAGESAIDAAWRQDVQILRQRLREIVARPEILHALYVASPSLRTGIEHWNRDPDSKKGLQAERALVRYIARMAARSTPFGLFSGCSVGRIDDTHDSTELTLKPRSQYRLSCRLDFDYLFALTETLRRDPQIENELRYRPNTSLHKIADAWYYTESRMSDSKRTHHLVKVESDAYLEALITRAESGATLAELVQAVLNTNGGAEPSEEEAREYVLGLARDNEILISDLSPILTGMPALDDVIQHLDSISSGQSTATTLKDVRKKLTLLESAGLGVAAADYGSITAELQKLPAKLDESRLYQVDMIKPMESAVLGKPVIAELMKGVEILCRIGQAGEPEDLKTFRDAFSARYESAMVPLLDALDEESGVGFGSAAMRNDASPLLRGLKLRGNGETDWNGRKVGAHPALIRQVVECIRTGKNELNLDLSELENNRASEPKLADAFCVMGTLIAESSDALQKGNFELYLHGAFGPSGARLLGRFCHEDPEIDRGVREHLRQEESHDSDAIFAEVVYLPEGRVGNVLCRPVLREYEIPYLGRSGAPPEKQLPVSDLLIGIHQGSIGLYSRRLGRRIIPRVTNAHGFMNPQLSSTYRFLCYLQHQHGVAVPSFSWGMLDSFDYLPRVRVGRIILSLARWRLSEKEVEALGKEEGSRRFSAVQNLRQQRSLPRWIVLQEGDNSLPVDLDNALSVDAFVHVLKRGSQATLLEMYPLFEGLCVTGAEGSFYHELNVPFVRKPEARTATETSKADAKRVPGVESSGVSRESRILPPGSEWLYVKLYGGAGVLDDVLTSVVQPLARRIIECNHATRWFFIRYADPQEHLRIRFNGSPFWISELLPVVNEAFHPLLASGKLWKIEFDTYQREIERYGGLEGVIAAEDIFFADSEAVLEILQELAGDEGLDIRWRVGLMGIDRLLSDFGFDENAKRDLIARWRGRMQNEFKTDMTGKRQMADRFRSERSKLMPMLDESAEENTRWTFAKRVFDRRSARNTTALQSLQSLGAEGRLSVDIPDLVASYSHMHINRMIRASQPAHELVLYDFLAALYEGRLARKAKSALHHEAVR